MNTLARLGLQARNNTDLYRSKNPFDLLRRHVTQLGRRFQAAKALPAYGARIPELKGLAVVSPIGTPLDSRVPPADTLTTFDSITKRMLSDESRLGLYQHALGAMDTSHDLFKSFIHNYNSGSVRPYVHAEVQVLDWFHKRQYSFAGDDHFIATSRPSCLCCWTYFRSHPSRVREPNSDGRICLRWRPAEPEPGDDLESKKVQKDTMNDFNKFIRKETLHQILQSSDRSDHPGFPNMAANTRRPCQTQKPTSHLRELFAQLQTLIGPQDQPDEGNQETESSDADTVPKLLDSDNDTIFENDLAPCSWQVGSPSWSCSEADGMLDDSDSEGGVTLPIHSLTSWL